MRRGKKIIKNLIIGTLMGLVMITYGSTITQADNVNTEFTFVFNHEGEWKTTIERLKDNSSGVYMKCTYAEVPDSAYEAFVYGYRTEEGTSFLASRGYTFYESDQYYMDNWVISNYADRAYIKAMPISIDPEGAIFVGVWRPDAY